MISFLEAGGGALEKARNADGARVVEGVRSGPAAEAAALGRSLAEQLRAEGAAEILGALHAVAQA